MKNEVCRRIEPLVQLDLWQSEGFRQESPKERIQYTRQTLEVDSSPRARQCLKKLKGAAHTQRCPGVYVLLFSREFGVRQDHLLPCAIRAEKLEVCRKGSRQQGTKRRSGIGRRVHVKFDVAQRLQKVVHQRNKQLTLRAEMKVKTPDCKVCLRGYLLDRRSCVSLAGKECERRSLQPFPILHTAPLARRRGLVFTGEQVRTRRKGPRVSL